MNMFKALFLLVFMFACGSDHKDNSPAPVPTPTPAPIEPEKYTLEVYYNTQIEGKDIGFSTEEIFKDRSDSGLVQSSFLSGERDEQGSLMDVCFADMRIEENVYNNYYMVIANAYHAYDSEKSEHCASFNGSYWIKLGSDYSISFDRVK